MEAIVRSELFWTAMLGGTFIAVLCAVVGYFLVLRALAFASEALTEVGFAGASGAILVGWDPFLGMLAFEGLAVVALALLGQRARGRDVEIGMVLSLALGLGVLFLTLLARSSGSHASAGIGLLFGSLLTLSTGSIEELVLVALPVLFVVGFFFRPLVFASVSPGSARARGVPTRTLDIVYLLILGITTAMAIRALGVLLAFSLLSAPAGAAVKFVRHPGGALAAAAALGFGIMSAGVVLAFYGPWPRIPVGVYVTALSAAVYGAALIRDRFRTRAASETEGHHHEKEIGG